MRLPTTNARQRQFEDARQLHERLYAAFQAGVRVPWPVTPATFLDEQARLSGGLHKFWSARGFRLRTMTNATKTEMTLWLEQGLSKRRTTDVGETMQRARKVGPIVPSVCVECGTKSDRRRAWDTFDLGECRECGGALKPRPNAREVHADAKAKRELAEQEGAA